MTASAAFAQSEPTKRGLGDFGKAYVQSDTIMSPDAVDRAAAATQANMLNARERGLGVSVGNGKVSALDARERALGAKHEVVLDSDFYADGFAQAIQSRGTTPDPVRDDRFRIDPTSVPSPVTVTSSGRELEWPTIGIGFGIGIVLLLGLGLVIKATHTRPFAH
jgi:hypothetical protein